MADHAPSFRYHPTLAPQGRLFHTHGELDALDPAWVDTPAKFPLPTIVDDEIADPTIPDPVVVPKKRGRPRKVVD